MILVLQLVKHSTLLCINKWTIFIQISISRENNSARDGAKSQQLKMA